MRLVILLILGSVLKKYNIEVVENNLQAVFMSIGIVLAIAQDVKELFRK